jgi:hypothetical protein
MAAGAGMVLGIGIGVFLPLHRAMTRSLSPVPLEELPREAARPAESPRNPPNVRVTELEQLRRLLGSSNPDIAECLFVIRTLRLTDCKEARRLLESTTGDGRRVLFQALANHWAELDPADAFDSALRERENDFRNRLGLEAARALVNVDPEAALARIASAKGAELRQRVAEWVIGALSKTNPARAAQYLASSKSIPNKARLLQVVASEYGRSAPEPALKWAGSLEPKRLRDDAIKSVWNGWAEVDPAAVAARLQGQGSELSEVYGSAARAWSKKDPAAALAWIESLPDKEARARAYSGFEIDLQLLGKDRARSLIDSISTDGYKENLANRIAQQLARESVEDALKWVESLPQGKTRENALQPVLDEWSSRDPAESARYMAGLPESTQKTDRLKGAISHWAGVEPDAAFAFVQQLPAGKERDEAAASAIRVINAEDPKKAMAWFSTIQDPKVIGHVAEDLVTGMVQRDSASALAFATQLPAESQPNVFHNLVRGWAFDHTQEAGDWINTLPLGAARDSAVEAFVSVIDGKDAALATQWAQAIQDPEARAGAFFNAFERWQGQDKKAATEWLNQNPLPDDAFRPVIELMLRKADQQKGHGSD